MLLSYDLRAASMTKQHRRREVQRAMTRQPAGPDAGADGGELSTAADRRNNGQLTRSMILQAAIEPLRRRCGLCSQ